MVVVMQKRKDQNDETIKIFAEITQEKDMLGYIFRNVFFAELPKKRTS